MNIRLDKAGRRFNQEWIFRNLDYEFKAAGRYAILGPNGSGKSTLLSTIMGSLSPSEGTLQYEYNDRSVPVEQIYQYLSFAAPYLDLLEEFTLQETIRFHFQFKGRYRGISDSEILGLLGLAKSQDKALKHFSSGMRQRTRLALAFCSDTPLLILDEPTSNLDQQGIDWYLGLIDRFTDQKLVMIGSNQDVEYSFCDKVIQVTDYK